MPIEQMCIDIAWASKDRGHDVEDKRLDVGHSLIKIINFVSIKMTTLDSLWSVTTTTDYSGAGKRLEASKSLHSYLPSPSDKSPDKDQPCT
jgi:hypothetical protein